MTDPHSSPCAPFAQVMLEPSGHVSKGMPRALVICGWAEKIHHDHQKKEFNKMVGYSLFVVSHVQIFR